MSGVIACYPHGAPVVDGYDHVIVFKSREHAQWCLGRMGHHVGGFTYHSTVGVSSGWTRKYNEWVRQKRRDKARMESDVDES